MSYRSELKANAASILSDLELFGYTERICECCGRTVVFCLPSGHKIRQIQKGVGMRIDLLNHDEEVILGRWGQDIASAFKRFLKSLNKSFPGSWHSDYKKFSIVDRHRDHSDFSIAELIDKD
jgi:hypothetical protein